MEKQNCWNCTKNDLAADNLLGNCCGFKKNGVQLPPKPIPAKIADTGCMLWAGPAAPLPVVNGPYEPGVETDTDGFCPIPKN